jgi:hypothetical protein
MTKDEIIDVLKNGSSFEVPHFIIESVENTLKNSVDYEFKTEENSIKINSVLTDGESGSYLEICIGFDKETNNFSLVTTNKTYNPNVELRNGWRVQTGFEIFTESSSTVFDAQGLKIYHFWFNDDHKYYGSYDIENLDYSKQSLLKYFNDTNPKYKNGFLIELPQSQFQPFTHFWERYGKSHVVKSYGRNPMHGTFSDIAITFDDGSQNDISLLHISNNQIFVPNKELKYQTEQENVDKIEELYKQFVTPEGFDDFAFYCAFDQAMFINRKM